MGSKQTAELGLPAPDQLCELVNRRESDGQVNLGVNLRSGIGGEGVFIPCTDFDAAVRICNAIRANGVVTIL